MAIKGGTIGSIKKLKAAVKRGGGSGYLERIKEGEMAVRFLTEPDQWFGYFEHYDNERKFYPCSDDCPGCAVGDNPSQRFLANVLDVESGRVIPLVIPKSLAQRITKKYEKYGTLTDRDYSLAREGTGLETEYDVEAEAPTSIRLSRYELLDLHETLEGQLSSDDTDDDDDDEVPSRPVSRNGQARKPSTETAAPTRTPPRRVIKKPGVARKEHEAELAKKVARPVRKIARPSR